MGRPRRVVFSLILAGGPGPGSEGLVAAVRSAAAGACGIRSKPTRLGLSAASLAGSAS